MAVISQIFVILAICLASEGISAALPFTFPASVIGMILVLILLFTKVLKPDHLKETSGFLLGTMAMYFIPACVSVLDYADVLLDNIWAILIICLITTPLVFFVAGHVVQLTVRLMRKKVAK